MGQARMATGGIRHQGEPQTDSAQMLTHVSLMAFTLRSAIGQTSKGLGTAMGEEVETACKHASRPDATASASRIQHLAAMLSRVRNIENPNRVAAMDLHTRLEPIRAIHHRPPLCGLDQMAPACLHLSQISTVSSIRHARARRERSDRHLLRIT